jgi:hypothetical protein
MHDIGSVSISIAALCVLACRKRLLDVYDDE